MPDRLLAAVVVAALGLACAPYLARLVGSAPDRAHPAWWRGTPATRALLGATAALAVGFGGLAGRAAGWTAVLPAFAALALVAVPLAVVDARQHRLPDRLVLTGGIAAAVLLGAAALVRRDGAPLLRAALAAVTVFMALFALALASPRSLGFGDVKLGALLGGYLGWLGWACVLYGMFAGFACGALAALALLATRRAGLATAIPLGPALIVGALLVAGLGH